MALTPEAPPISPLVLRFFRNLVRRYFRRHFRAVQAQGLAHLQGLRGPLIVYGNHSSWWDPMLIVLLGEALFPFSRHYAPIDARALDKYPVLRKLGIFPVEMASPRGAAQFLRTAGAILREGGVLWLTPQGRFADPREFPLAFKPGLAALAARVPDVPVLPLAVEYTFWDERLPEALLRFAEPVQLTPEISAAQTTRELEEALATTMLALQSAAMARDPGAFTTLLTGRRGTGGMYGAFRRLRAVFGGPLLAPDHTERADD